MVAGAEDIRHARYDIARVSTLVRTMRPDDPVALFRPDALARSAATFQRGFPGQVSYAVKANPSPDILRKLVQFGIDTFDVASVAEMQAVRAVYPEARLHYHNPIRSKSEIAAAKATGIASWSVDRLSELEKLGSLPKGTEIAVRFTLKRGGAVYEFGSKFGATPQETITLLKAVKAQGLKPSLTFHPGTQCTDPTAWSDYIAHCATLARQAGVHLFALNVGGGFPAQPEDQRALLPLIFKTIESALTKHFPDAPPTLWCEPGRAMVSDAVWLLLKVKARSGETLYLNDGLYGALGEWRDMPVPSARDVFDAKGQTRSDKPTPFTVFGPTCDSLDRVPGTWDLPHSIAEDDHILIRSAGAYSTALVTGFNGYGTRRQIDLTTVASRTGQCGAAG